MPPRANPAWPLAWRALLLLIVANLVWESAQLPLYTLWRNGSTREIAVAVLHCTAGDAMIATAALGLAILVTRAGRWPNHSFRLVLFTATAFGLGYTIFSEWLNVSWRGSWTYAQAMPRLPLLGTGLSPVLQWLLLPPLSLLAARRLTERPTAIGATP